MEEYTRTYMECAKLWRARWPTHNGWHVSFGPTLMLRAQFIAPFVSRLGRSVEGLGPVGTVHFDAGIEIFASNDGGRFFAGPVVSEACRQKCQHAAFAVSEATKTLALVEKPLAVEEMRFHCSLAWTCVNLAASLVSVGISPPD